MTRKKEKFVLRKRSIHWVWTVHNNATSLLVYRQALKGSDLKFSGSKITTKIYFKNDADIFQRLYHLPVFSKSFAVS